jgi:hypothetical protein
MVWANIDEKNGRPDLPGRLGTERGARRIIKNAPVAESAFADKGRLMVSKAVSRETRHRPFQLCVQGSRKHAGTTKISYLHIAVHRSSHP